MPVVVVDPVFVVAVVPVVVAFFIPNFYVVPNSISYVSPVAHSIYVVDPVVVVVVVVVLVPVVVKVVISTVSVSPALVYAIPAVAPAIASINSIFQWSRKLRIYICNIPTGGGGVFYFITLTVVV